jgi:preprotein translocase subunit SecF
MGLQIVRPDTHINFMEKRKLAMILSVVVLCIGFISLIFKGGLQYGIDFAGGINIQVQFTQGVEVKQLKSVLKKSGLPEMRVQRFGMDTNNEFLLRIPALDMNPESVRTTVQKTLANEMGSQFSIQRLEMVGPKVGSDLKNKALKALFYAVLLISIYISGRFEQKWGTAVIMAIGLIGGLYVLQLLSVPLSYLILAALLITLGLCWYLQLNYALGAIVALIHDVLITLGIFSFLNKDVDLTTIAALLTIIGYSLNDTIVIFDRIRENLRSKESRSLIRTINVSINQTLSRTILTSGTSLLVIVSLYILGGGVIHDFALALMIGIVSGTYSSIFVASPLLLGFGPTPEKTSESAEAVKAS